MNRLSLLFILSAPFLWGAGADVTGTWYCTVDLPSGSGSPTLVLKQENDKITGTYSGTLGETAVQGTIAGDKVQISFEAEAGGQKFKVTYDATLKNDNKEMEGKVIYGDLGEGAFSARKKE
jgi:hypothetical protein